MANGHQVITQGWEGEKKSSVAFTPVLPKVVWPCKSRCNPTGNTVQPKNPLPTHAECCWAPHPKHLGRWHKPLWKTFDAAAETWYLFARYQVNPTSPQHSAMVFGSAAHPGAPWGSTGALQWVPCHPPHPQPKGQLPAWGDQCCYTRGLLWGQDIYQDHSYLGCSCNVTSTAPNPPNPLVPMSAPALHCQHLPAAPRLLAGDGGGCSGYVFSSLISRHPSVFRMVWQSKAVLPAEGCPCPLHGTTVGFPPLGWQVRKIQLDRQLFPLHQGRGTATGQWEGHPRHPSLVQHQSQGRRFTPRLGRREIPVRAWLGNLCLLAQKTFRAESIGVGWVSRDRDRKG